jgi:hypothetical protein
MPLLTMGEFLLFFCVGVPLACMIYTCIEDIVIKLSKKSGEDDDE